VGDGRLSLLDRHELVTPLLLEFDDLAWKRLLGQVDCLLEGVALGVLLERLVLDVELLEELARLLVHAALDERVGHLLDDLRLLGDVLGDDEVDSLGGLAGLELEVDGLEVLAFLLLHLGCLLLLVAHEQPILVVLLLLEHVGHVLLDRNADGLIPALERLLHLHH